jgi:hypothetical protein
VSADLNGRQAFCQGKQSLTSKSSAIAGLLAMLPAVDQLFEDGERLIKAK